MLEFNIQLMSCGHCVKTITQAVRSIDPAAQVQADLATHVVRVTSTAAAARLSAAIAAVGYANTPRG